MCLLNIERISLYIKLIHISLQCWQNKCYRCQLEFQNWAPKDDLLDNLHALWNFLNWYFLNFSWSCLNLYLVEWFLVLDRICSKNRSLFALKCKATLHFEFALEFLLVSDRSCFNCFLAPSFAWTKWDVWSGECLRHVPIMHAFMLMASCGLVIMCEQVWTE